MPYRIQIQKKGQAEHLTIYSCYNLGARQRMLFFKCGRKGLFLSMATQSHCKKCIPKLEISEGTTSCISFWLENFLTSALEHRLQIQAAGIISLLSPEESHKSLYTLCIMKEATFLRKSKLYQVGWKHNMKEQLLTIGLTPAKLQEMCLHTVLCYVPAS